MERQTRSTVSIYTERQPRELKRFSESRKTAYLLLPTARPIPRSTLGARLGPVFDYSNLQILREVHRAGGKPHLGSGFDTGVPAQGKVPVGVVEGALGPRDALTKVNERRA